MANYIVTDKIRVNIVHGTSVPSRVKCEQYDGDYTKLIQAIVYNGDVLYDIPSAVRRIVVSGLKPDGNGFSYDCTWSGNIVSFSLMRQMTAVNGDVLCNITMFDSENNQVSSAVFVLAVEKAALPSDVVVSSNDFQTFVDYVQAANLYWQYSKSYAVGNTGIRSGENADNSQYYAHLARMYKGSPLTAATASAMTDTTRVYVYTGSESGYNNGHWYFYNDSAWEDGGVYNAQGQQTDTELSTPGIAADAEATGIRLNKKVTFYNTVALMIADAANLKVGDTIQTLGYYSVNDGGGAEYKIVSARDNNHYYENISNNLFAELVIGDGINVKQLGAYGDNTHDDIVAIQTAFDLNINRIIIPTGVYLISDTINIERGGLISGFVIDGDNCKIAYNGNDYAIQISKLQNAIVKIGCIYAPNGGGIHLVSNDVDTDANDYVQYIDLYFKQIYANTNCICGTTGSGKSWVNEIHIYNGRLAEGNVGIKLEGNSLTDVLDQWLITNVGFEGVSTCVNIAGNNTMYVHRIILMGCRYLESFDCLIKTRGLVEYILVIGTEEIAIPKLDVDDDASNIYFFSPTSQLLVKYSDGFLTRPFNELQSTSVIARGTNLNDLIYPNYYTASSDAVAASLLNCPVTKAFRLKVISASGADIGYQLKHGATWMTIRQEITTLDGQTTYMRLISTDGSGNYTYRDWVMAKPFRIQKQIGNTDITTLSTGKTSNYDRVIDTLNDFISKSPEVGEFYGYSVFWDSYAYVMVQAIKISKDVYRIRCTLDSVEYVGSYDGTGYSVYKNSLTPVTV